MLEHFDLNLLRQREDDAATRGFFGGLFLGILLGVVIALVFAPRRGAETRAVVGDLADDIRHKASDLVHRGEGEEAVPTAGDDYGDDVAIEREINVEAAVERQ